MNLWCRMTVFHSWWGLTCVAMLSCAPGLRTVRPLWETKRLPPSPHKPAHRLLSKPLFIRSSSPRFFFSTSYFKCVLQCFQTGTSHKKKRPHTLSNLPYKVWQRCIPWETCRWGESYVSSCVSALAVLGKMNANMVKPTLISHIIKTS